MESPRLNLGLFSLLPDSVICCILGSLEIQDILLVACTAKALRAFCLEEPLWMVICLRFCDDTVHFEGSWQKTALKLHHKYQASFAVTLQPVQTLVGLDSQFLYSRWYRCFMDVKYLLPEFQHVQAMDGNGLSPCSFFEDYDRVCKPGLFTHLMDNWPGSEWTLTSILHAYGSSAFTCSTPIHTKVSMTLSNYAEYMDAQHDEDPLYVFDPNFGEAAPSLCNSYSVPKIFDRDFLSVLGSDRPDYRWLVMGPARSGASWHVDPQLTSAWNALLSGRKRWALYPPYMTPPGVVVHPHPDGFTEDTNVSSSLLWFLEVYPTLEPQERPLELIQNPGEVVFVPGGWWHCVLNLEPSIAVTQNFVSLANLPRVLHFLAKGGWDYHSNPCDYYTSDEKENWVSQVETERGHRGESRIQRVEVAQIGDAGKPANTRHDASHGVDQHREEAHCIVRMVAVYNDSATTEEGIRGTAHRTGPAPADGKTAMLPFETFQRSRVLGVWMRKLWISEPSMRAVIAQAAQDYMQLDLWKSLVQGLLRELGVLPSVLAQCKTRHDTNGALDEAEIRSSMQQCIDDGSRLQGKADVHDGLGLVQSTLDQCNLSCSGNGSLMSSQPKASGQNTVLPSLDKEITGGSNNGNGSNHDNAKKQGTRNADDENTEGRYRANGGITENQVNQSLHLESTKEQGNHGLHSEGLQQRQDGACSSLEEACGRVDGELRVLDALPLCGANALVFLLGDIALKLYNHPSTQVRHVMCHQEAAMLKLLEQHHPAYSAGVYAPLVRTGEIRISSGKEQHPLELPRSNALDITSSKFGKEDDREEVVPFLVLSALHTSGSLREIYSSLDHDTLKHIANQLGRELAYIHLLPWHKSTKQRTNAGCRVLLDFPEQLDCSEKNANDSGNPVLANILEQLDHREQRTSRASDPVQASLLKQGGDTANVVGCVESTDMLEPMLHREQGVTRVSDHAIEQLDHREQSPSPTCDHSLITVQGHLPHRDQSSSVACDPNWAGVLEQQPHKEVSESITNVSPLAGVLEQLPHVPIWHDREGRVWFGDSGYFAPPGSDLPGQSRSLADLLGAATQAALNSGARAGVSQVVTSSSLVEKAEAGGDLCETHLTSGQPSVFSSTTSTAAGMHKEGQAVQVHAQRDISATGGQRVPISPTAAQQCSPGTTPERYAACCCKAGERSTWQPVQGPWSPFVSYLRSQRLQVKDEAKYWDGIPKHLRDQVEQYLPVDPATLVGAAVPAGCVCGLCTEENVIKRSITHTRVPDAQPCLLHGDLTMQNVLVSFGTQNSVCEGSSDEGHSDSVEPEVAGCALSQVGQDKLSPATVAATPFNKSVCGASGPSDSKHTSVPSPPSVSIHILDFADSGHGDPLYDFVPLTCSCLRANPTLVNEAWESYCGLVDIKTAWPKRNGLKRSYVAMCYALLSEEVILFKLLKKNFPHLLNAGSTLSDIAEFVWGALDRVHILCKLS